MQLPPGFPHTRYEQYLVALPSELLTHVEVLSALSVIHRAGLYVSAVAAACRAELSARGYSEEDIERVAFPGLPAALYPPDELHVGDDDP